MYSSSLDSMEDLSQSLSILKGLASKYDQPPPRGSPQRSAAAASAPAAAPSRPAAMIPARVAAATPRALSPGRSIASLSARGSQQPKPPWRPARSLSPQRPASPAGRRTARSEASTALRAARCVVTGEGMRLADLKKEARFTVRVHDEDGRPAHTGGERVRVVFRGRSAPELELTDMRDGSYEGRYTASVSGTYEMLVMLDGKPVAGSPFLVSVRAGNAHVANCIATGEGLYEARAGQRASFHVRAFDHAGVAKTVGGDTFEAALHGPALTLGGDPEDLLSSDPTPVDLLDLRNGSYTGHYVLQAAGDYLLTIADRTTGEELPGSPYRVSVLSGQADGTMCHALSEEVHGQAGEPMQFDFALGTHHTTPAPNHRSQTPGSP